MRNLRCKYIFVVLSLLVLNGSSCSEEKKISQEELIQFCEELETSILNRDPKIFNKALYQTGLQYKVFEGYKPSGGLRYALNQTLIHQYRLGDGILSTVMKGDFLFEVTKIYHDEEGNPWAVFRLFNGINFNYVEFQFQKVLNEIKIVEGYYYNVGKKLSEIIRSLVFLEVGFDGKGKQDKNIKKYYRSGVKFMMRANRHLIYSEFEKALEEYELMDKRLFENPYFFVQKLNLLAQINEVVYYQDLEKFNQLYTKENRFNIFNSVQLNMYKGEVEATRKSIHNLSKYVGNDAVLDYFEANALLNNKDYEKAVFYFEKFIEQRPKLSFGYFAKAIALIEKKDFENALNSIGRILQKFETDIYEIKTYLEEYPEFLNSEEFELWQKGVKSI